MSNKINTAIDMYKQLDEKIKNIEKEARKLRQQKVRLENYIKNTIEANNLQDKEIKVDSNTKIKYISEEKREAMSQKYIKSSLEEYFIKNFGTKLSSNRCQEKADEIYSFLLNNRKMKSSNHIKFVYT